MTVAERVIDLTPMVAGRQPLNIREKLVIPDCFEVLQNGDLANPEHNVFRIQNPKTGDDRLTWDRRDFSAIQEARRTFIDLVKKGFKPFQVGRDGNRTNQVMQEFDPTAQQVLFVPMPVVVGG